MYTVLVVDDEKIICEGIKSMIHRIEDMEIKEVFMANSALEAEKIAMVKMPEIIITDIKMPEISGIELIEKLKMHLRHSKFLVLSGYSEFQNVRDSFKLGVSDYLLKPARISDLKDKLKNIIDLIREEKEWERIQQEQSGENQRRIMETYFNKVFSGKLILKSDQDAFFRKFHDSFPYECLCVGLMDFREYLYQYEETDILDHAISKWREAVEKERAFKIFNLFEKNNYLCIILNFSKTIIYDEVVQLFRSLISLLKKAVHSPFNVSFSSAAIGATNISDLYNQALGALDYKLLEDPFQIIEYEKIKDKKNEILISEKELNCFESYIKGMEIQKISDCIDRWFSKESLKNHTMNAIKKLYYIILQKITDTINNGKPIELCENEMKFSSFNKLCDLRIYFKEMIFKYDQNSHLDVKSDKSVIDFAKNYIEHNYFRDMSMAEIANAIFMNYSYFSKLFKENTGTNFSIYLQNLRMKKAKEFLSAPHSKIHEVAVQVGYHNANNFTRAFKNHCGLSPQEFKKPNKE